MAYDFDGSTDDATQTGLSTLNTTVVTMAVSVVIDTLASNGVVIQAADATAGIWRVMTRTTSRFRFYYEWSGGVAVWQDTTALSTATAYNLVVRYDRSSTGNNASFSVNGGAIVTPSPLISPSGTANTGQDRVYMGEDYLAGSNFNGRIERAACWGRGLSDGSMIGVSKGRAPDTLPDNLTCYWPMFSTPREMIGGGSLTVTGATVAASFGAYTPKAPSRRQWKAAAAATTSPWHHYRQMRAA